jgi:hypothetical protein
MMMSPHILSGKIFTRETWTGENTLLGGQGATVPVCLSD